MEVSERHTRARAIIRDHVFLQIGPLEAVNACPEATRVSFLMCPFCVRHLLPRSATVLWTSRLEPQRQRCHAVEYRRAHGTQAPPVLDEVEGRPVLARAEGGGGAGNRLRGREGACAPGQAHRTAADLRAEALSGDRVRERRDLS